MVLKGGDWVGVIHISSHTLMFSKNGCLVIFVHEDRVVPDALHLLFIRLSTLFLTLDSSKIDRILSQLLLIVII